jgi:transcriptional regulator GlxA family with amidase domain
MQRRKIILVAFQEAQLLDVAGPADVFNEANKFLGKTQYDISFVSSAGGRVVLSSGLPIETKKCASNQLGGLTTVILAGGNRSGLVRAIDDKPLQAWVQKAASVCERIASVCTGAFALAHWGLLDGQSVTTHWSAADALARSYGSLTVNANALYLQEGKFWTSGGVTAGIDMCLAMLESDHGRWLATRVAKQLALSTRRVGNQGQYSSELEQQAGRYGPLIEWVLEHIAEPINIYALATQAGESERTFCRRFAKEIGVTPAAYIESLRIEKAKRLLEGGNSAKAVAKKSGFTSEQHLSRTFRRRLEMTPMEYARLNRK